MKTRYLLAAAAAAALACIPITAAAQASDLGKREYESNCAVCHGKTGKGDGAYVELLNSRVPDLTTMSKRNGGTFPFARVYEVIDGSQFVKAHGTRDMPIWGTDYQIKAAEYYADMPYNPQIYVRGRILALTEYLARLQAK
jgi:mono/diheme cytochrome c family protein